MLLGSMAMKSNTLLDFVELQLAPPRTRCELFVSANGVREKLASGFLKPFLTHLQAAEEQVTQGCSLVRLGHPQSLKGKSWFTKGTLERFVRFVSTPELLERVKSIEDELAQLEQVRSIQASSLFHAEDIFVGPGEVPTTADGNVYLQVLEKKGSFKLPIRRDDLVEHGEEASKVELLRAMDLRVRALQQEQSTAFDRALAAGFSNENMADLIAFSEHFGAERLRTACLDLMDVVKTRHEKYRNLDSTFGSSCSDMLLHSVSNHAKTICQRFDVGMSEGSHDSEDERVEYSETAVTSAIKETHLNCRGSVRIEVRKRWGPPENIRAELFINQNGTDSASSSELSNGTSIGGSPEIQSSLNKNKVEQDTHQKANLVQSLLSKNMSSIQGENSLSAGTIHSQSLKYQADGNKGEPLSADSCSMSFQKIQSNSSVPNRNSSSQDVSLKVKSGDVDLSSNERNESRDSGLGSETLSTPVVEPTRRLSVQDAISLFENKQRRESVDSVGKHHICKQENGRESLEGAGTSSSGSIVLKRWDSGKSPKAGTGLQENGSLSKLELAVLDTECSFHTSASRPVASGTLHSNSLQVRAGGSLARSISRALVSSNTQLQTSTECGSAKVKATNDEQSASSEIVTEVCDGDWRKQFKLQLEKSLAKDCFTRDTLVEGDLEEHEFGISISKKILDHSKTGLANATGMSATMPFVGNGSRVAAESGTYVEAREVLPVLCSASLNTAKSQDSSENCKSDLPKILKEDCETELLVTPDSATKRNCKRESLDTSSIISLDHDTHALVFPADNQTNEYDKGSAGSKGRLYEQYRKLRDAKLMEDQDFKRAEREAKLRTMEETLRMRKAELDARVVRLLKNSRNQARSLKAEVLESELHTQKREQQDGDVEVAKSVRKDETKSTATSTSLPSTPYSSKDVSTLKPQGGRKAGAVSQKGATPPRSANRPIPSVSPKVTPKITTVGAGNLQKSMASSRGDNPLARSVPCFANLRKENTKPSPGRPLGSARVHPKSMSTGRTPGVIDTPPLEANGYVPVRTNLNRSGPIKEEQRSRSAVLRKSYATVKDLKTLSTSSDDGILAPRRGQKETTAEPAAHNKLRRSAVGIVQEAKPFLRKGRGIVPGTGPGAMKQKIFSATDMAKSSDEDIMITQKAEENDDDGASQASNAVLEGSILKELSECENMDVEDDAPINFALQNYPNKQAMRTLDISESNNEAELNGSTTVDPPSTGPMQGTLSDAQRTSYTISLPVDMESHNVFAEVLSTQSDSDLKFDPDAMSLKEEDIEALSQHDEDAVWSVQNQPNEASVCASLCAVSPPHEHSLVVSLPVPPPPPPSSLDIVHQEESSPPFSGKLESPMVASPAAWISSQVQRTDVTNLDKKWAAFQKPVIAPAPQPKESVKGFKRLLKFRRKSRSSEVATADCISASTTSEGDDESEEQSRFAEEVSSRGMLFEQRYNDVFRDHNQAAEEGSARSLRSSIPAAPPNFKVRDDHIGGGTMLRAPRSFFSLSSFRTKGNEGRLRSREHGHG